MSRRGDFANPRCRTSALFQSGRQVARRVPGVELSRGRGPSRPARWGPAVRLGRPRFGGSRCGPQGLRRPDETRGHSAASVSRLDVREAGDLQRPVAGLGAAISDYKAILLLGSEDAGFGFVRATLIIGPVGGEPPSPRPSPPFRGRGGKRAGGGRRAGAVERYATFSLARAAWRSAEAMKAATSVSFVSKAVTRRSWVLSSPSQR
jgi:hypothetical protein